MRRLRILERSSTEIELTEAEARAINAFRYADTTGDGDRVVRPVVSLEKVSSGLYIAKAESVVGTFHQAGIDVEIVPRCGARAVQDMLILGSLSGRHTSAVVSSAVSGSQSSLTERFLAEVRTLLSAGLQSGYAQVTEIGSSPRGKIDFTFAASGKPFPPRYSYFSFSTDTEANRLIGAALDRVRTTVSPDSRMAAESSRLRVEFPSSLSNLTSHEIVIRNTVPRYQTALAIAAAILDGGRWQGTWLEQAGSGALINMSRVFEDFVTAAVLRSAIMLGAAGHAQGAYYPRYLDSQHEHQLHPDATIWRQGECEVVADAKYKPFATSPTRADLYQMAAYSRAHGDCDVLLIYSGRGLDSDIRLFGGNGPWIRSRFLDLEQSSVSLAEENIRLWVTSMMSEPISVFMH